MKKRFLLVGVLFLYMLPQTIFAAGAQEDLDFVKERKLTEQEVELQKSKVPILHQMTVEDTEIEPVANKRRISLPEEYDSREEGIVTSVKDQGSDGNCWAYAAVSAAEISAMKKELSDDPDFSEEHLSYFFYNRVNDPLSNTADDKNIGELNYLENGGNSWQAAIALSNWTGIAEETIFSDEVKEENSNYSNELAYQNSVILQNARFLSNDLDEMKQAIMDYGSIVIMYNYDDSYMNYDTAAYSYPGTGANHAVCVVGWNDNYSAENFLDNSSVCEDGAWIVKNSWSEEWGDSGYFYLSYEDKSISSRCAYEFQSNTTYDNNYYYDGNAVPAYEILESGESIASIFEVKGNDGGDEILKAVQFILYSPNIGYEIQIYKNPSNCNIPDSGTPVLSETLVGRTEQSGVYTIELNENIRLRQGEKYAIVITLSGENSIKYGVECNWEMSWISFKAGIDPMQSFVSDAGEEIWTDLSSFEECARIKGFTVKTEQLEEAEYFRQEKTTGLRAVSAGKNKVKLLWDKVEEAEGYLIYAQKEGKYGYVYLTSNTTYLDSKALDDDYNFYWVFPYVKNAAGKIVPGKCEKYVYAKGVCPAVTKLKASSADGGVKLTWSASYEAEGYLIYGIVGGKAYGYVGMTVKNNSFTDKTASKKENNFYWVYPYHKDADGKIIVGGTPKYTYGRAL